MFGHDNMVQAQKELQSALIILGKAKGQVSSAIMTAADATSTGDTQHGTWATLATAIGTAITDLQTAIAEVYFYPEQPNA